MATIPAEFEPHFRKSPVTAPWEPLYSRRRADGVDLAFEVQSAHCNARGLLHGGVLAALCDNFMGLSLGTQLRGYHADSTADILDEARAPKGSMYHHFPLGKEQVAIAAVARIRGEVTALLRKLAADGSSLDGTIRTIADGMAGWLRASGWR